MKRIALLIVSAVVVFVISCKKDETDPASLLNETDLRFITQATIYDSTEVLAAEEAITRNLDTFLIDTLVGTFARDMLTAHRQAMLDLRVMGSAVVGFTVTDTITPAKEDTIAHLKSFTLQRDFDSAYLRIILNSRQQIDSIYRDEVFNGSQRNLKAYASSNLQRIRLEYERADSIYKALFP